MAKSTSETLLPNKSLYGEVNHLIIKSSPMEEQAVGDVIQLYPTSKIA